MRLVDRVLEQNTDMREVRYKRDDLRNKNGVFLLY
jgi:hypothetical protein